VAVILWCDGAHDAAENMRRDAALLAAADRAGAFIPVLRLFRFEPHGITLGYAQRPERELDLARCARDRVRWAVRTTGGRALCHGCGKVDGIAQRRSARALRQQGCVLLGPCHLRLLDYLSLDELERAQARERLLGSAATLEPYLGANPPLERWAESLERELGP